MFLSDSINSEVTFLAGVNEKGVIMPITFETWVSDTNPAQYGPSTATKWGAPEAGTPATISFAFIAESNWTSEERLTFITAMNLWSAVANVTFVQLADETDGGQLSADFRIVRGDEGGAFWSFGDRPGQPTGGTTMMTPEVTGNGIPVLSINTSIPSFGPITLDMEVKGSYPFDTVVHELGHGIGLGHGGPYNGEVNAESQQFGPYDMKLWTVMSYIDPYDTKAYYASEYPVTGTGWGSTADGWNRSAQTPMMLDILAAQRLYGAPTSGPLVDGGVVFGFNSNIEGNLRYLFDFSVNQNPVVTIWSGGTGNTLDLSGFAQNALINLQPGTFSSAAGLTNNIGIAFDTIVETAIGGSGNDRIYGTEKDNVLIGNAGFDIIYGGGGNDQISGGAGPDFIVFGSSGKSVLRDLFGDLNGDIVVGMNTLNTIEIVGSLINRSDLNIQVSDDTANFSLSSWSFRADGAFTGGDFMLTPRIMGDEAHTLISFVNFLPALAEGVTVNPALINGIANEAFMWGDGSVSFSMTMVSADSAYQNSLGTYKISTTGAISDVQLLIDNTMASSMPGTNFSLGTVAEGEQIGFFLIQDGFKAYGDLPDDLAFVPGDNGSGQFSLYSASRGFLTKTDVFHASAGLNTNDINQVLSGVATGGEALQIGFEDVANGLGDNDFQDVVISLQATSSTTYII